ncbi:MAG: radical SAM protein [Bacteroidota bacterium]|nr:radical SAM protein [Bacteroidota bacterium]
MKTFNGKAIYNPSGKAGEYSYWACNFYVGCSNDCSYCYCKKGILGHVMGNTSPTLKKCFKNELHALEVFEKELKANLNELHKHGLFFSFTTDPCLKETIGLTQKAINIALKNNVPCKLLTKCVDWVKNPYGGMPVLWNNAKHYKNLLAFGFTLTGHDELEPNASSNAERIEAMKRLHEAGFKTWASIEPIIDFDSSWRMIVDSWAYCDLFKIGLESGGKYDINELIEFIKSVNLFLSDLLKTNIYWKDSILKAAGFDRDSLPENCVYRDFNLFQ